MQHRGKNLLLQYYSTIHIEGEIVILFFTLILAKNSSIYPKYNFPYILVEETEFLYLCEGACHYDVWADSKH